MLGGGSIAVKRTDVRYIAALLFNWNWEDRPNLTEPLQKRHDGVYMGEMDTDGWKHGYGVLQR
jgi:hypothetical protein